MVLGILCALLAGACFAVGAGLFSAVVRRGLPFLAFLGGGAAIATLLSLALVVRWDQAATATRGGELAWWIVLGAVANVGGHAAIARAMAGGNAPVAWAISQGGQGVPFLAAVALWGDRMPVPAWCGLAAVLAGVWALSRTRAGADGGGGGASRTWALWALAALLCYGLNGTLMGVPSRWPGWHDAMRLRAPLTLGVFALAGLAATRWDCALLRRLLPLAIPYGLLLPACFLALYTALDLLAAAGAAGIAWPMACGGGIALFALWERVGLRRPLPWRACAGIALIIAGIAGLAVR